MSHKYNNPPIAEAVIDIQVDPPLAVTALSEIEALHEKLLHSYPEKKERRAWEAKIELKEGNPEITPRDHGIDGYQFWSADKKQICQYRLGGFTLSRLTPYESWESFLPEAMKLWEIYQNGLTPLNITKLAVRYINLIKISEEKIRLEEYIENLPKMPNNLPNDLDSFLQRLVVPLDTNINGITTLALHDRKVSEMTVLLDIDVFSKINLKLPSNSDELRKQLDKVHDNLIKIFENSLTQKTKDLFE